MKKQLLLAALVIFSACSNNVEPILTEAKFSIDQKFLEVGSELTLTNQSDNAKEILWTFGDGTQSTAISPTHTYSSTGEFNITLETKSETGSIDTFQETVTVGNLVFTSLELNKLSEACANEVSHGATLKLVLHDLSKPEADTIALDEGLRPENLPYVLDFSEDLDLEIRNNNWEICLLTENIVNNQQEFRSFLCVGINPRIVYRTSVDPTIGEGGMNLGNANTNSVNMVLKAAIR
ncbi:PKD domain-containing protein [Roseivirga misakiensis]|uniref:PKD domain-containing protein n=1 Tax=Roseivirga misakiensis TaxID=1563681 RepID=A0A1E5SKQ2_9BACT|nr:PKD domain-containing protein [Roseivirga misakiensis]OEJ99702.1 hypothetical protein BFP71_09025 [Roseivirga misakiensis]